VKRRRSRRTRSRTVPSFPHLAALAKSGKPRADLEAILLTGIPAGLIPGFQNHTGAVLADNGRRVFDDVVTIELRAIAGVTYPLVAPGYHPDAAAGAVMDGLRPRSVSAPYLTSFPYLGAPYSGYDNPS
jgi:hypothetical protein